MVIQYVQDVRGVDIGGGPTPAVVTSVRLNPTGDATAVAAVAGKQIIILALTYLETAAGTSLDFKTDDATGAVVFGQLLAADGFVVLPFNPFGWGDPTVAGEALFMDLDGGEWDIHLTYAEV